MRVLGLGVALSVLSCGPRAEADCYFGPPGEAHVVTLARPVTNDLRVVDGFGFRAHPLLTIVRMHPGVDFAGPVGSPVTTAAAGEVVEASRHGEYGNYVLIRHPNGLETEYAHLQKFAPGMTAGRCLGQGDVIGTIGTTGLSTGPHLHFGVRAEGFEVDPLPYLISAAKGEFPLQQQ